MVVRFQSSCLRQPTVSLGRHKITKTQCDEYFSRGVDRAGQAERGRGETLSKSQEPSSSEKSHYSTSVLTDKWSFSRWRRREGRARAEAHVGPRLEWVWSVREGGGLRGQIGGDCIAEGLVCPTFRHYFGEPAHCTQRQ